MFSHNYAGILEDTVVKAVAEMLADYRELPDCEPGRMLGRIFYSSGGHLLFCSTGGQESGIKTTTDQLPCSAPQT